MTEKYESDRIKEQSRMLDADLKKPKFRREYSGKVVAYCDHKVLIKAEDVEQAIDRIPQNKMNLPIVIRFITEKARGDFMGGSKGF